MNRCLIYFLIYTNEKVLYVVDNFSKLAVVKALVAIYLCVTP